jgi:hypothetical protein
LGEKESPDGFIRRQRFRQPGARGRGDRTSEHAIHVGHCANDTLSNLVLQLEDIRHLQIAIEDLGPKMRAGVSVHQLHSYAQLFSRLAQASFHDVARAQFVADSPHVDRLSEIARRRAARDHPEIGKTRKTGDDLVAQPFRECRNF